MEIKKEETEEMTVLNFRVPASLKKLIEAYARQNGYTVSYFLRKVVEMEIISPELSRLRSDFLADIGFALALLLKETLPKEKVKLYAPLIGRLLEGAARLNMENLAAQIKEEIGS